MCLYLHFHLCTSGLDPKDEKFWQTLFMAHTILSLPFIFHGSLNLLVSALTFNFLGFVSLSQTFNLIQNRFALFNFFFQVLSWQKCYENLKKDLAQTALKTKLFFSCLKQRGVEKC